MKLFLTVNALNPKFSKEYAKQYNFGKESDGNWKYLWGYQYVVENVDKTAIVENGNISLDLETIEGKKLNLPLSNVTIFECFRNNEVISRFIISKSLIKRTQKTYIEKSDITRFYFYLKGEKKCMELMDGIYLSVEEIPNELKIQNQ